MTLLFTNRVAIVTGAGNGLGRAYALLFGIRGAKVVVNDLGGGRAGEGETTTRPADAVVAEIRAAGGEAVADYHSVEDGAAIVATAISRYGRLDIVVNNAGILRDHSIVRMTDQDWDLVQRVHLKGSFMVSRAAFPHFRSCGYGRIIMTSSVAGIYGNYGQANYSAAKLGLHGLCQTLALEGAKYNIQCNTIAPMGGTRLTQDVLPPELFAGLKPELIAPLVLWLCHEDCQETGGLFEAAGGWFGKYRFERSVGRVCRGRLSELVTPEEVRRQWSDICSFEGGGVHPASNQEAAGMLAQVLEDLREKEEQEKKSVQKPSQTPVVSGPGSAKGLVQKTMSFSYTTRDVILYALGVGVSTRQKDYLNYLYEGSAGFSALPTYAIIAAQDCVFNGPLLFSLPGWQIDVTKILHGEQHLEVLRPLPTSGTLYNTLEILDVLDKTSGAVIVAKVTSRDNEGTVVAITTWSLFVVGAGNFGGPRNSELVQPLMEPPKRAPDATHTHTTTVDQAALYRLSGDSNPLHMDPEFAALGGFPRPILHGLCSLGFAVRAVMTTYGGEGVELKALKVRFVRPVYPGQSLVTDMWQDGARICFRTMIRETGEICLTGGYIDLTNIPTSATTSTSAPTAHSPTLLSVGIFARMGERVERDGKRIVDQVNAVFLWNITVDKAQAAQWTVDLKNPPGKVYPGLPTSGVRPDVTLTIEDSDLDGLVSGDLNPQKAFMTGKLKVAGNIMLSQKLHVLFDKEKANL